MTTINTQQEMLEKSRWMFKVRFVASALILFAFAIIRIVGWLEFPFLLFAISPLLEMFVNQPYAWLVKKIRDYEFLFLINQALDILIITWGIHFLGVWN